MKFEYDGRKDKEECVAFIDGDGDLCVKDDDGKGIYFLKSTNIFCEGWDFTDYMESRYVIHRFYPGDKITITF